MNITEAVRLALRALAVNKLRSALTMLGIIIGVGAVITLLSVGQGVQTLVTEQLQSIGTNLLFVVPGNIGAGGQAQFRLAARSSLTSGDVDAIADPFNAPSVARVAPELMSAATVSFGKKDLRGFGGGNNEDEVVLAPMSTAHQRLFLPNALGQLAFRYDFAAERTANWGK